jgi:hypothetical protein
MSRKNKYLIAVFVIVAAMIGFGIIFCIGIDNQAKWTDSDQAFIIPLGIMAGIGFFVAQELWDEMKKEKKK